jgi:hypothetical protein
MIPDSSYLTDKINLRYPIIGLYDIPDVSDFTDLVEPTPQARQCIFVFFKAWAKGKTLWITRDNYGCRGCNRYFWGKEPEDRKGFISFLVDDEGLKANHDLMERWIEEGNTYKAEHDNILMGPLQTHSYEYIKTITFFVNPDQLSALMIGAQYFSKPDDPIPVLAPFGSGCGEILPLFDNLDIAQSIIGSTDLAMRKYLPHDIMAFTTTKKMFEQLCSLDDTSFLNRPFLGNLKKARGGELA